MMRAADRKRLRAIEEELQVCVNHRYVSDLSGLYEKYPDLLSLHEELSQYLEAQRPSGRIPTYYYYWRDDELRKTMWALERDPVARAMWLRLSKASSDAIDGRKPPLKRVGDGTHLPVEEDDLDETDARLNRVGHG